MQAVFLDQKTFNADISLQSIKSTVTKLTCYETTAPEQVLERCIGHQIIITNKVIIDENMLAQLPNLKLICIAATGTNNVDLLAAKNHGVVVTNVSGYAKNSVAQYVFAQLLEFFNQTSHHNKNTVDGLWQKSATFCVHGNSINELAGKTLGIIGYGDLGKSVEKIANAFEMNVLIAERQGVTKGRSGRALFERVLAEADIISLHCPQTPETTGMVNKHFINQLKPNTIIINTARGPLINNDDLLDGLRNGKIAGAILDVLDEEPPSPTHPLLAAQLSNLKITAHIAWASMQAQQRLIEILATNISCFKRNKHQNILN